MKKTFLTICLLLCASIVYADGITSGQEGLIGHWSMAKEDTVGVDLVTNGTFDADTDWTKGTGWSIGSGVASSDGTQEGASNLSQDVGFATGNQYVLIYTVSNYSAGTVRIFAGAGGTGTTRSANGTYTETLTATTNSILYVQANADFVGDVDNVIAVDSTGIVLDLTQSSNAGTVVGAPEFSTDRHGQSNKTIFFDSGVDYVDLSSSDFLTDHASDTQGSISMWFKTTSAANNYMFTVTKGTDTLDWFVIRTVSGKVNCTLKSSATLIAIETADIDSDDDNWHHVVVTQNGTTSYMYVDGVLDDDTDSGEWFNNLSSLAYFRIGGFRYNNGDQSFIGSIDDVRYYDHALTQTDVTAIYEAYNPHVLVGQEGLAGSWSLAQDSLKSSTVIYDLTPNLNDGTLVGSPSFTTDRKGVANKALALNGSTQYVDLSSSNFITDYGSDTKGSISVWFNATISNNGDRVFGISDGSETTDRTALTFVSNIPRFRMNTSSQVIDIQADNSISSGSWYNVVVTQDGTTSKMYVNGVLQTDTDSGEWLNSLSGLSHVRIGCMRYDGTDDFFFSGSISDVRYYSGRALSQAEVTALYDGYNSQLSPASLQKGIKGWWSLSDGDTTIGGDLNALPDAVSVTNEADATTNWLSSNLEVGANVYESQSSIVSDGSYAFKLDANDTPSSGARIYFNLISRLDLVVGETYTVEFDMRHLGTGGDWQAGIVPTTGDNPTTYSVIIDNTDTTWQTYSFTFELSASTDFFVLRENSATNDGGAYFDKFIVKDSSGTVMDKTPYSNDGARVGSTWTTDRKGQSNKALEFDGASSEYIDLSSSDFITDRASDTKGSICFWMNGGEDYDNPFSITNDTVDTEYMNFYVTPADKLQFIINDGSTLDVDILSTDDVADGSWHHVVVTQDASTSKMYIDGSLQADTDSGEWLSELTGLNNCRIADIEINTPYDRFFDGKIDDFRYYNRDLTQAEVTRLYEKY